MREILREDQREISREKPRGAYDVHCGFVRDLESGSLGRKTNCGGGTRSFVSTTLWEVVLCGSTRRDLTLARAPTVVVQRLSSIRGE